MGWPERDIAHAKGFIAPPGYSRHRAGRAGFGLRRDAPAFPGERGRFRCPRNERANRRRPERGLDLPFSVRLQPGTTDAAADLRPLIRIYPPQDPGKCWA